jgi:NarL family two-component system sensor histidine kinase LiaS
MKKILLKMPEFTGRLWWRLTVTYSVLTFFGMALLMVLSGSIWDYSNFHKIVTPDNIYKVVSNERLLMQGAIDMKSKNWLNAAGDHILEKLHNLEYEDAGNIYRITSSGSPEIYLQITDKDNQLLLSEPSYLPRKIADIYAAQKPALTAPSIILLKQDQRIWLDIPLSTASENLAGHVRVLFLAQFNPWIELESAMKFVTSMWPILITSSIPIGLICGLVAANYVTRRLRNMNLVTESWRQGNFDARIVLPNDDELTRHSQILNDMAQDLELFMSFQRSMAVGDERNRVARELHDTVKQKLFALGLQLAVAKSKPAVIEAAGENILEAETITREAQHDLMEIITQLRPPIGSDYTLYERMEGIIDDFRRRFNVTISVSRSEGTFNTTQIEHHVLRIVQEALMNAVRHGKATHITIVTQIDQNMTMLLIKDDGVGFDTGKKMIGFGITSMRDRTHELPHGRFELTSEPGTGTQITVSWKNEA